nr:PTS transporter subunit EIIC [Treponemataceae bacterium]
MKSQLEKVIDGFERVKNNLFFRSVRDGMVMALPILLVGSIAVMLGNLPFPGYKPFISSFAKGAIAIFLNFIQNSTFGILSVYITLTISIGLINNLGYSRYRIPAVLSAISSFFIFEGIFQNNYDYSFLGAKGMFSAIIAGFCATYLFITLSRVMKKIIEFKSGSTDSIFTEAMNGMIPFVITIACSAVFNLIFVLAFDVNGFNEAFVVLARHLFNNLGTNFFSSFLFLFCIHFLWIFGIHGNNVMQPVAESLFLFDGQNFLCKPLFDVFCLAGGSGATWCYILAVLIFCKRKRDKKLEYLAILPSIFNINELIVFGTPVIFNPVLVVPFVLTPLLFLCTTYLFYYFGFLTELNPVEWTTPYFLSGYFTTGSWRGVLVQFINLVLGTGLYFPFVKINEKLRSNSVNSSMDALVKLMQESEKTLMPANLTNGTSNLNIAAKYLSDDLKKDLA